MTGRLATAIAAILVLAAIAPLAAQQPRPQPPAPARAGPAPRQPAVAPANPAAAPERPPEPPPPYEPQLLRLAELLGALSFLRPLCGHGDGAEWRARMAALIEAEASTEARKEGLAGAFNRGFRDYARTYRACTASARLVIERFVVQGAELSREVANRYRG